MYNQDSFFTLSLWGQLGLFALSMVMFAFLIYAMTRLRGHWARRLSIALIGIYLFTWLSPQVYYSYYLLVFDGLPLQIVVGAPPTPAHIFGFMTFSGDQNLSVHGQGLLGWGMIITSLSTRFFKKCRNAAN